jgi:hypothetical protein
VTAPAAGGVLRRRAPEIALATTCLLAVAYAFVEPRTADLAAATFRADLWSSDGFVLFNEAWYSGHTVPGYSLLYPPLGALVGPVAVLIASAIAAVICFSKLAEGAFGDDAWIGTLWFGLAATVAMWGGRVPFALGLAIGLGALLALQRGRLPLAAGLALLTPLASPVAGLFLALAAAAVVVAGRLRLPPARAAGEGLPVGGALVVGACAFALTALLGLVFPTDGYEPFRTPDFLWLVGASVVLILLVPSDRPAVRWGAVLYLLLGTAAFVLETPFGDNAMRLGYTFAGPLLAMALVSKRPLILLLLAAPLLYWQWTATANDMYYGLTSPTDEAAFHAPLLAALDDEAGDEPLRIHIPPTRTRWETVHVGETYPLARGWLRQLESDDFKLFRQGRLDPASYQAWLDEHGVSYVALTRESELDYMAFDEADLLESGTLPFMREVYADDDWTLWEVERDPDGASALASAGATVTELGPDSYTVAVDGPGSYELRVRYEPWMEVVSGRGCIEPGADDLSTRLGVGGSGPTEVRVESGVSLDALTGTVAGCEA